MLVRRVLAPAVTVSAAILLSSLGWQAPAQAAQEEEAKGADSGSVTLRLTGDKGTPFSGTCSVGEKEHDISARVPESIEYELNGRKLACEIRKQEKAQGAELKVVLKDGDTHFVHRSEDGEDTAIWLVSEDGSVSFSMSSSSSQMMSSTSGSSSSAASDARQRDYDWERFADQIQEKVNGIIERALL